MMSIDAGLEFSASVSIGTTAMFLPLLLITRCDEGEEGQRGGRGGEMQQRECTRVHYAI